MEQTLSPAALLYVQEAVKVNATAQRPNARALAPVEMSASLHTAYLTRIARLTVSRQQQVLENAHKFPRVSS
jgi:hypothetical protein